MAANDTDRIFVSDSYPVFIECYEPPTSSNQFQQQKVPKNASSGLVRMWNVLTQAYVNLGVGVPEVAAIVSTNTVSYTIPSSKTGTVGDYKISVVITFPDGQVQTTSRKLKIQDRV